MTPGAWDDHRIFLIATAGDDSSAAPMLPSYRATEPECRDVDLYVVGALRERDCSAVGAELLDHALTWRRVNVDLSEVSRLSAAGFGLLVELQRTVARNDGEVNVVAASPAAAQIMDVLNWSEVREAVVEAAVR